MSGLCEDRGISVKKTKYKLEIIFDSELPPRNINSEAVETALLTALAISVGGEITIIGGQMKLSVWQETLADIPHLFWPHRKEMKEYMGREAALKAREQE